MQACRNMKKANMIDKNNYSERLITYLRLHRMVLWKPWALVWFTCVLLVLQHSHQRSVFPYLNPPGIRGNILLTCSLWNMQAIICNHLRSVGKQGKQSECWSRSILTPPLLLLLSSSTPTHRPCLAFLPSSLRPGPSARCRAPFSPRWDTQGHYHHHTHTPTDRQTELFTENLVFDLLLSRPLIHSTCPQDLEASHTHSYRRTPG